MTACLSTPQESLRRVFCQQHAAFGLNADLAGVFLPVKPNGFKQESIPAAESPVFAQRGD